MLEYLRRVKKVILIFLSGDVIFNVKKMINLAPNFLRMVSTVMIKKYADNFWLMLRQF